LPIDQYALEELSERNLQMIKCYNEYDFTAIFHSLSDYSAVELSSFYLDIIKDRLYVEQADGKLRRSAQTACWYILDTMTRLMAPILSFTAEQLSDHYQKNKTSSIHLQEFATLGSIWDALAQKYAQSYPFNASNRGFDDSLRMAIEDFEFRGNKVNSWEALESMRSAVLKGLEGLREQGIIKHSLEASVTLYIAPELQHQLAMFDKELKQSGQSTVDFFKEFFIVSDIKFATEQSNLTQTACKGLFLHVERAAGDKCPRCWRWEVSKDVDHLCVRCQGVLGR
jgi:isoleucyl-tRNA synthetase